MTDSNPDTDTDTETHDAIIQTVVNTREQYQAVVRSLTDEQLNAWAFGDPDSWTVRQLLAHLAGSGVFLDRAVRRAQGETVPVINADEINAQAVAEREGRSIEELLAEYGSDIDGFIERVRALDAADLQRELVLGPQTMSGAEVLLMMSARHTAGHIRDISTAVGLPEDTIEA